MRAKGCHSQHTNGPQEGRRFDICHVAGLFKLVVVEAWCVYTLRGHYPADSGLWHPFTVPTNSCFTGFYICSILCAKNRSQSSTNKYQNNENSPTLKWPSILWFHCQFKSTMRLHSITPTLLWFVSILPTHICPIITASHSSSCLSVILCTPPCLASFMPLSDNKGVYSIVPQVLQYTG